MEKFKQHPAYTAYQIGDQGKVIGPSGRGIGSTKQDGYRYVWISNLKVFKYIHRLVWETYVGPIPSGMEINHKDGNKLNCALDNLELLTHQENVQHSFDVLKRLNPTGKDHHLYGTKHKALTKAKMALKKVGVNHPKFKGWYVIDGVEYPSAAQAAASLGISYKTIIRRCNRRDIGYNFIHSL